MNSKQTADTARNTDASSQHSAETAHTEPPTADHIGYTDVSTPSAQSGELDAKHRAVLEIESGISSAAIAARGYFSTTDRNQLGLLGFSPKQRLVPSLVGPLWNWKGERVGHVIRPDIPRTDTRSQTPKPIKYESPVGQTPVLDVAPLTRDKLTDKSVPLVVTEGAKKADSAASRGLPAINLNGVWGFQSNGLPLAEWHDLIPHLRNRIVYVIYDSDVMRKRGVEAALRRLHQLLKSFGAIVKVVYFPDGENGKKIGLDDFFAEGGTLEQLYTLARDLESVEESKAKRKAQEHTERREEIFKAAKDAHLPVIETAGRQEKEKLADLARAIDISNTKEPRLFQGFSGLVQVITDPTGDAKIKPMTRAGVQNFAVKSAVWVRTSEKEGTTHVGAPRDLCEMYQAGQENWEGVPLLEDVASAPFFAADGTLCSTPGYWPSARTWLQLPDGFQVGDTTPTPENVAEAKRLIFEDVFGEVAFADQASRAHTLALAMLPFVRRMIKGPSPLHLVNAPLRASGKSYLACLAIQPFGEPSPSGEKSNAEEWRKSLVTQLATGPSHAFLDNVKGSLNSSTLDAMITSESGFFEERLTGTGDFIKVKTFIVWVATANNAQLTEDAGSRSLVIQLDPNLENPDQREFKRNPMAFIRQNRGRVCGAILTLINAWLEAGCPDYSGTKRFRFPQWLKVIGGILDTIEVPGILENLEEQRAQIGANAGSEWHEFTELWWDAHSTDAKSADDLLPLAEKVADIDAQFGKDVGENIKRRKFAQFLAKKRDRIFGGLKIRQGPPINRKVTYRLERLVPKNAEVTEDAEDTPLGREREKNKDNASESVRNDIKSDGFAPNSQTYVTPATSARAVNEVIF